MQVTETVGQSNGTSGSATFDELESRIEQELNTRRAVMRTRAAYGDALYRAVVAILSGYRKLDSKNIPARAKIALAEAEALVGKIDSETDKS